MISIFILKHICINNIRYFPKTNYNNNNKYFFNERDTANLKHKFMWMAYRSFERECSKVSNTIAKAFLNIKYYIAVSRLTKMAVVQYNIFLIQLCAVSNYKNAQNNLTIWKWKSIYIFFFHVTKAKQNKGWILSELWSIFIIEYSSG